MLQYSLIGGTVLVVLALIKDANGSIKLVTAVITIRGVGWLCQRITNTINKDCSDIINFTSWCLAGVSVVGLIKNCIGGFHICVQPVLVGVHNLGLFFDKIGNVVDGVTFWN